VSDSITDSSPPGNGRVAQPFGFCPVPLRLKRRGVEVRLVIEFKGDRPLRLQ
jgi:hypothetical protein